MPFLCTSNQIDNSGWVEARKDECEIAQLHSSKNPSPLLRDLWLESE